MTSPKRGLTKWLRVHEPVIGKVLLSLDEANLLQFRRSLIEETPLRNG